MRMPSPRPCNGMSKRESKKSCGNWVPKVVVVLLYCNCGSAYQRICIERICCYGQTGRVDVVCL